MASDPKHRLKPGRPTDYVIEMIERADAARGGFIGSYAQIEFILAHFALKAAQLEAYAGMDQPFPYNFGARAHRVRQIAEAPGPLQPHRDSLLQIVDGIEPWEWYRHIVTHGWMEIHNHTASRQVTFLLRKWEVAKGGKAGELNLPLSIEEMEEAKRIIRALAEFTVMTLDDIYTQHRLETWRHPPTA